MRTAESPADRTADSRSSAYRSGESSRIVGNATCTFACPSFGNVATTVRGVTTAGSAGRSRSNPRPGLAAAKCVLNAASIASGSTSPATENTMFCGWYASL